MKYILLLILSSFFFLLSFQDIQNYPLITDKKSAAFTVLQEKCNVCHQAKKRIIFTLGNMETQAKEIHRQVFIKKRMPKGKKFPMTAEEYDALKNWLDSLDIQ